MRSWILVGLAVPVLVACTAAPGVTKQSPDSPQSPASAQAAARDAHDTLAFEGLNLDEKRELEAASAAQVITIYLEAINNKQYDKAVACLDNRFISADEEPGFKERLAATLVINDVIISPYTIEEVVGPSPFPPAPGLHFAVSYKETRVGSSQPVPFERFFTMMRDSEQGRWRVMGIGTGP